MRHHESPEVGHWFKDQGYNDIFEVVASDVAEEYVEIQYFAGEIDEVDLETWYQLDLKRIPAPEDWSGPYEISREELGYPDETIHPEDWSGPITELEPKE